jgi:hypothetical protein
MTDRERPLRFGGAGERRPGQGPWLPHASEFTVVLGLYRGWRLAREPSLPTPEQLRDFHPYDFAPDLRSAIDSFEMRGMSLREMYAHSLSSYRDQPRMCISSSFANEPLGPGVVARQYAPDELVELICRSFQDAGGPAAGGFFEGPWVLAPAFDERHAHVITLIGVGEDGCVCYRDPFPGASLFSSERGSLAAGVPHPRLPDTWCLERKALARILVAAFWPPATAREELRRARTEADEVADVAIAWVSNRPGSRLAVTLSATALATVLEERGHADEALHWWRQAALVGGRDGTHEMAVRLGPDSAEGRYWGRMDDLGRRGLNRWTMPDEEIPEAEEVRFNKQADDARMAAEFAPALDLGRAGRFAEAKRRFIAIREGGSDLERAAAAFFIGKIWRDQDEPAAAVAPLFEAAASANLHFIGPACVELGAVELELDRRDSALDAFERGAFSGDERVVPDCEAQIAELS